MSDGKTRFVYANSMAIQAGDNDVLLRFGMATDPTNPTVMEEQVVVVITPRTAKLLVHALSTSLTAIEKQFGEIKLPQGIIDQIKVGLAVANKG